MQHLKREKRYPTAFTQLKRLRPDVAEQCVNLGHAVACAVPSDAPDNLMKLAATIEQRAAEIALNAMKDPTDFALNMIRDLRAQADRLEAMVGDVERPTVSQVVALLRELHAEANGTAGEEAAADAYWRALDMIERGDVPEGAPA